MTILLEISNCTAVRAYTELCCYTIMLICILITYGKLWQLEKVRFFRILLMILLINSLQGIWSGFYWSPYLPGPYTDDNAMLVDIWVGLATLCNLLFEICTHLTIWLVSFKFYNSASQLKLIEKHLEQAETKKKKKKESKTDQGSGTSAETKLSPRSPNALSSQDDLHRQLSVKVAKKKCLNLTCFHFGGVIIVTIGIMTAMCRFKLSYDKHRAFSETTFHTLLIVLCGLETIISLTCFYALYLLFIAISIMRANANKTGNSEGTRDVYKILISALLITVAIIIDFLSFIILALLRYKKISPFDNKTDQRDSWTCVF